MGGPLGLATLFACSGGITQSPSPMGEGGGGNGGAQAAGAGRPQGGTTYVGGTTAVGGATAVGGTTAVAGSLNPGGMGGLSNVGVGGRRPAVDTCEGKKKPITSASGQSCEDEGFACYYQPEAPQDVQNYFISYTCCCGTWFIQMGNSPSRSYSCEEVRAFNQTVPADCSAGGASGAGGAN
jgi:hypothetical protein